MIADRYGLHLSTSSPDAAAAYVEGVDLLLSANAHADKLFGRALAADHEFALAHAGLARASQAVSKMDEARAAAARARELAAGLSPRERSHVDMLSLLVEGQSAAPLAAAKEHLVQFPRDVMVLSPCTSVFGLIGFSGRARREHELAALLDGLARHYGDDWWFLAVHGFALGETGRLGEARRALSRSLDLNPRNANAAHFFTHLLYEEGNNAEGLVYLEDWLRSYPREAPLHCHLNWHVATWQLERGDLDAAWQTYEERVSPNGSWGPAINTLTDSAAFLWRTELSGHPRDIGRWQVVRNYALRSFPRAGISYADVHAALAFAAAGDTQSFARLSDELRELEQTDRLPAGPIVPALADAFGAAVNAHWGETIRLLEPVIGEHERIGGSRAQRDLIEYTLLKAYVEAGRTADAERMRTRARNRGLAAPVAGL